METKNELSVSRRSLLMAAAALATGSQPVLLAGLSEQPASQPAESTPRLHDIRSLITGYGIHPTTDQLLHQTLKYEIWDGTQWADTNHRFDWWREDGKFGGYMYTVELVPLDDCPPFLKGCFREKQTKVWCGRFLDHGLDTPFSGSSIFGAALKTLVRCRLFNLDLPE